MVFRSPHKIIHAEIDLVARLKRNYHQEQLLQESEERTVHGLTIQSVLLDIAINAPASSWRLSEIAAKKLTPEYLYEYFISFKRPETSMPGGLLDKISDTKLLQKIAKTAKFDHIRWGACKRSGGHIYDKQSINKCKCTICCFQHHIGCPNNGTAWNCKRCGGTVKTIPFVAGNPHSTICFKNGTVEEIDGYDGILYGEERFI